jgi:hypothetical protein
LFCETPIKTGTTIDFFENPDFYHKQKDEKHKNKEYTFSQPLKLAKICYVQTSCFLIYVEIIGLRAGVRV